MFVLILFASLNFGVHYYIVLPGFKELERVEALKDMDRCIRAIKQEIGNLDILCHDWAAWDDLYEFMDSPSPGFVDANLNLDTMVNSRLNLVCITDIQDKVFLCQEWDLLKKEKTVLNLIPEKLRFLSKALASMDRGKLSQVKISGIYSSARGPMAVSIRPVITSENKGPVRGGLILGRLLDGSFIGHLSKQVEVDFRIFAMEDQTLTEEERQIAERLDMEGAPIIEKVDSDHLLIYSKVSEMGGGEGFLIRADIPRHIMEKGVATFAYSLIIISVLGIFMAFLVVFLLRKIVVSPIMVLTDHVLKIANTGDLSFRIFFPQKDEIGMLGKEVNRLVSHMESQTAELAGVNARLSMDIEKRKDVEHQLKYAFSELSTIFENSQVGIMVLKGGRILHRANQRLADILGYNTSDEMVGLNMRAFHLSEENYMDFGEKYFKHLAHGKQIQVEYRLKQRDGSPVWCTLSGKAIDSSIPVDLSKGVVWIMDDITEKKLYHEKLEELACTDFLTGLCNRRHFVELSEMEIERQLRYPHGGLCLIMLDIDYFKVINDTHGHDVGDLVLKHFTGIAKKTLRDTDLFARIGGEEFVVLLPETDLMGSFAIAERLRQTIEQNVVVMENKEISFTASFGVTAWDRSINDVAHMMKNADKALYAAKRNGRNRVECHKKMDKP